ncbi:hypothetical protein HRM2_05590 [Desulforapulum autotrophicum HRM2]|uniref:Uncharacterized protein n=1 Tax=Desulforapulum autotrophicum (strain ATCC 43914 / DSM 3382 / VKM B-1955 / HRM2) TaxID=177437 RepID=C0QHW5_DESAH|nr:hypothetical protein HRM2_05590 [Desulforapulum autotrophicum HRM2]
MFQSLLSWIRHSRFRVHMDADKFDCFNPCCRGSGIPGARAARNPEDIPGFQSLLSWIRHSRKPGTLCSLPKT